MSAHSESIHGYEELANHRAALRTVFPLDSDQKNPNFPHNWLK